MDDSAEANVGTFPIGPSTLLGRTIAVRVLLCKSISEFQKTVAIVIILYYNKWKRFSKRTFRRTIAPVFSWLHPRNPHALLALIVGIALILKRYSSVKSKAQIAYRRKFWRNLMCNALTYDEWSHAAKMLEKETPKRNESDLYDEELVKAKLNELQRRRKKGGLQDIIFYLRADLVRNLGNMCNPDLHKGRLQMPKIIKDYIDEVSTRLRMVCDSDSKEILSEEKLAFMQETKHAFGRTALLLSGGASLDAFHVGVVKTLIENRLLPRVVAGASVGSIICVVIATRTWPELQSFFADSVPTLQLKELFNVNRFIVSQANPHIAPLLRFKEFVRAHGGDFAAKLAHLLEM